MHIYIAFHSLDTRPPFALVVRPREDSNGTVSRDVLSEKQLIMSRDKLACHLIYFANDDWSTVNHI